MFSTVSGIPLSYPPCWLTPISAAASGQSTTGGGHQNIGAQNGPRYVSNWLLDRFEIIADSGIGFFFSLSGVPLLPRFLAFHSTCFIPACIAYIDPEYKICFIFTSPPRSESEQNPR